MNTTDTNLPYRSLEEHLNDCLSLVDMFLDAAQEEQSSKYPLKSAFEWLRGREEASAAQGIVLPLPDLCIRFRLTDAEYFFVLLALAPELNSRYTLRYSQVHGDPAFLMPTLDFANALYSLCAPVPVTELIGLTDRRAPLNVVFMNTSLTPKEYCNPRCWILVLKKQVLRYILGDFAFEELLEPACGRLTSADAAPEFCLPEIYRKLSCVCQRLLSSPQPLTLFCLTGRPGSGRKFQLSALKQELALEIFTVDMTFYYGLEEELTEQFLEYLRSATAIMSATALLDRADPRCAEDEKRLSRLLSCLSGSLKLLFLSLEQYTISQAASCYPVIRISYPIPDFSHSLSFWDRTLKAFPTDPQVDPAFLASSYSLTPGDIRKVCTDARLIQRYEDTPAVTYRQLVEAVSQNRSLALGTAAVPVRSYFTWDDLIIPSHQKEILKMACSRIRNHQKVREEWDVGRILPYGRGLSLLLYGPPGTGKTMAAQVISKDLGLDLYRVDLSQLLSKYIGETEKTLHLIFEEAAKSDIILFFDEADAVFSKRTQVNTSNDKFSNNSTSYILQKIEEYDGMVILSTNYYQNIDSAFLRRITYTVRFEMPQKEERLRLWTRLLPSGAPVSGEIPFALLAEHFELSGSEIKSILINGAYIAAEEGDEILTEHVVRALKYELSKTGRTLTASQLERLGL